MLRGHYVISFAPGVLLRVGVCFDQKHFHMEDLTTGGQTLALRLGGTYLYFDEAPDVTYRTEDPVRKGT